MPGGGLLRNNGMSGLVFPCLALSSIFFSCLVFVCLCLRLCGCCVAPGPSHSNKVKRKVRVLGPTGKARVPRKHRRRTGSKASASRRIRTSLGATSSAAMPEFAGPCLQDYQVSGEWREAMALSGPLFGLRRGGPFRPGPFRLNLDQ